MMLRKLRQLKARRKDEREKPNSAFKLIVYWFPLDDVL